MSEEFMRQAIRIAVENVRQGRGGPFGALVVKDGRMIGSGANRVTATNDPTAHAEMVAIRAACAALGSFQLTGCDVYASSEPCPMCQGAIYWARPARVFFGTTWQEAAEAGFDDRFIYEQFLVPRGERRIPLVQLLPHEARRAFEEWAASPGKALY